MGTDVLGFDLVRPITIHDLNDFLRIRNLVRTNLHDSRKFTPQECLSWFKSTENLYLGLYSRELLIGYFRLKRLDFNTLEVGLDLDPLHQGKGIGFRAYVFFIEWLRKNTSISTLTLRVLKSNQSAIKLYQKLGFTEIDNSPVDIGMALEILRNSYSANKYFESENQIIINKNNLRKDYDIVVFLMSHNQKTFLIQALQTIQSQKDIRVLVIVHDDASTDGSQKIISRLASDYDNVTAILQKQNRFTSFNDIIVSLLKLVDLPFFFRMDADDYLLRNNFLKDGVDILKNNSCISFVHSNYLTQFDLTGKMQKTYLSGKRDRRWFIPFVNYSGPGVIFRKSEIEFPANFNSVRAQDWYLLNIASTQGAPKYMDCDSIVYRVHSGNRYYGVDDGLFRSDSRVVRKFFSDFLQRIKVQYRPPKLSYFYLILIKVFTSSTSRIPKSLQSIANILLCRIVGIRKKKFSANPKLDFFSIFIHDFNLIQKKQQRIERIRSINIADFWILRKVKNENSANFFYGRKIGLFHHLSWFIRNRFSFFDSMFLITVDKKRVGVFGLRLQDGFVDIYNVIRIANHESGSRKGLIGETIQGICKQLRNELSIPIKADVLNTNPAIEWYHKNGFMISESNARYSRMIYFGDRDGDDD